MVKRRGDGRLTGVNSGRRLPDPETSRGRPGGGLIRCVSNLGFRLEPRAAFRAGVCDRAWISVLRCCDGRLSLLDPRALVLTRVNWRYGAGGGSGLIVDLVCGRVLGHGSCRAPPGGDFPKAPRS
jgi:hypothetical protein